MDRRTTGPAQELTLAAPERRGLGPGQAVLVKTGWGLEPALRRTFYPIALTAETWTLRVPPDGDWGHAWLRAAAVGSQMDCLGPVGTGFGLPPAARNLLCLGEGEASWALLPAAAPPTARGWPSPLRWKGSPAGCCRPPPPAARRRVRRGHGGRQPGPGRHVAPRLDALLAWADAVFLAGSLAFYGRMAAAIQATRVPGEPRLRPGALPGQLPLRHGRVPGVRCGRGGRTPPRLFARAGV